VPDSESGLDDGDAVFGTDRAPERSTVYWIIIFVLVAGGVVLERFPAPDDAARHTVWEFISTTLAFVVGALALVRFYSKRQATFLFIGTGFLGTGLLDAYHALITSDFFGTEGLSGRDPDVAAWSWIASRLFLSLFLFGSALLLRSGDSYERVRAQERSVYVTAAVLTVVIFTFFLTVDLASAYYPDFVLRRPAEILPAIFFFLALYGYLQRGRWRTEPFEHWLIISLVIGVMVHAIYMSQATDEFDAMADAGHLFKIASYLAVLSGLMISVFVTLRRESTVLKTVRETNEAMAREMSVRRDAESRLQNFLDNANDLILIADGQTLVQYVNRAWVDALGYAEADVVGRDAEEFVAPEYRKTFTEVLRDVARGGDVKGKIVGFQPVGGDVMICSISANGSFTAEGKLRSIRMILRDETEKYEAQRELADSQANLNALVENTGDAIWSVDHDHRLITFNSGFALAMEARTGREPGVGDLPEDLFSRELAEWYREAYDLAFQGARFSKLLTETVGGEVRHLEQFFNPIQGAGVRRGVVVFGKDVTRRRRAEEELIEAKNDAEAANQAKSHFLASMSHELRTPLNSVIGFANILLKNKDDHLDKKDLGFLERIQVNGTHLLSLINEILDLAKIEAGRMDLELRRVGLAGVVHEAIALVDGQIRLKQGAVEVKAAVPDALEEVKTDSAKLKQVIVNLVGNALKFTEKGEIVIRVRPRAGTRTPHTISVSDTGIGIPPDRLDAIFEAFSQAEAGTSRKYGGTGLGLAISRSMCLLLGYDLTVESTVGEGTTFTIIMDPDVKPPKPGTIEAMKHHPAPPKDEEPETVLVDVELTPAFGELSSPATSKGSSELGTGDADQWAAERGKFAGHTVLVVDDEHDSRFLLRHHLTDFGLRVIMAENGREGIEVARAHQPDLITLDLEMPDMDGWEALRRMKADPSIRHIPVVIASIRADEGRGRILGAVDALSKPVDRADLLRVLWRNLAETRRRVLVVDDDPDVRQILSDLITSEGLEVLLAENGREGIEVVERETPDVVLLDLRMAVLDGMGFLRELRANPYHKGLPVIVVTSKDVSEEERRELADLASALLSKGDRVQARLKEILRTLVPPSLRSPGSEPGGADQAAEPSAAKDSTGPEGA
jgi:PAS domain S-box-containing protein